MNTVRSRVAIFATLTTNALIRWIRRGGGTVAGGRVGLRLDPTLLGTLTARRDVICVSGTNGKTTTTALVARGWGDVVTATDGANMPAGMVAALSKRFPSMAPVALETDEAWLPAVVSQTAPRVVILLNLSRDQLDRGSEVRQIAQKWRDQLGTWAVGGVVVANASDPLVVYACESFPNVRWVRVPLTWRGDAMSCPHCTQALTFGAQWTCTCGFSEPEPLATLEGEVISMGADSWRVALSLPGDFNVANAAMAAVALHVVGVPMDTALTRMASLRSVGDRFAQRSLDGRTIELLLAKNPAGTAALLEHVVASPNELWMALNAQIADGRDPSWIYDVPFERLAGRRVTCFGERRLDLATRLTYAGVDVVLGDDQTPPGGRGAVTMIANYTAFQAWRRRTTS